MSAALLCTALGVTSGQGLGYDSPVVIALVTVGILLIAVFVRVERRSASPMIDLQVFRNPLLTVSIASGYLVFVSVSATFFLLPFFLEDVLGYDTRKTGLALGIAPLVLGIVAPVAGTLSDRMGVRRIALAGLAVIFASFVGFRMLDERTTILSFSLVAIPIGLGVGAFQSPNNSAIMGSMPREYAGVAGGMLTLTRLLGQVSGVALMGSLWAARTLARASEATGSAPVDAASAPAEFQVGGLHDTALAMVALTGVALLIGWWGMRKERSAVVVA